MATQRLTKKCFEPISRTEIRKIAVKGMNLPAEMAYKLDNKGIIDWVFSNAKEVVKAVPTGKAELVPFSEVDLGHVDGLPGGSFRQGVLEYLQQLQGFILKKEDKPTWPGDAVEADTAQAATTPETPTAETPKEKAMFNPKTYGKKPTTPVIKTKTKPKQLDTKPKAKAAFSKARVNKTATAPTADTGSIQQTLEEVKTTLAALENLTGSIAAVTTTNADYKRLEKGLLYVINMLCEEGQEVTSLDEVPETSEYITQ